MFSYLTTEAAEAGGYTRSRSARNLHWKAVAIVSRHHGAIWGNWIGIDVAAVIVLGSCYGIGGGRNK